MKNDIYGNPHTFECGQGIGDLFNGMLALASIKKKNNEINYETKISTPFIRYDLVNLFKNANFAPITQIFNKNLHVVSMGESRKNYYDPLTVYDYFKLNNLNGDEIFNDFNLDGVVSENITSDDVIIFPITSGAKILDNGIFLNYLNNEIKHFNNVYWNIEPHRNYRKNIPDNSKLLDLSISNLLTTIKHKKPKIIGHRSGIFDILFSIFTDVEMYCFYDIRDPVQMNWILKNENELNFSSYINKRTKFKEIFV